MDSKMLPVSNDVHLADLDPPILDQVKLDQFAVSDALRGETGCPIEHLPQAREPGAMAEGQHRTVRRKNTLLDAQDPPPEVGKWLATPAES